MILDYKVRLRLDGIIDALDNHHEYSPDEDYLKLMEEFELKKQEEELEKIRLKELLKKEKEIKKNENIKKIVTEQTKDIREDLLKLKERTN